MYLITLLLLRIALVTSHPSRRSPQFSDIPAALQCANGSPTCPNGMPLICVNGDLICFGGMVGFPVGKCSECEGSICAKGSDAYPGDKNHTCEATHGRQTREAPLHVLVEREVMERQVSRCQAQWECACMAFDGKGYYTRGVGGQCPVNEGASEKCTEDAGYLCYFGCRSELLKGFTNEKCDALFPGTRAVCKSY